MITLTFPDGAQRQFEPGISGREVAEGIAKSLARRTVAMALDGTVTDLSDPITRDARIEFLGREDFQVKIRGHRIELAEIEAALAEHPDVAAAAVIAHGDAPLDLRLAAFAEPRRRPPEERDGGPSAEAVAAEARGNVVSVEHHREGMDVPVAETEVELSKTIEAGRACGAVTPRSLAEIAVDTTVMEKAIAHPTDSRLYERARRSLLRWPAKLGSPCGKTTTARLRAWQRRPGGTPMPGSSAACARCCGP